MILYMKYIKKNRIGYEFISNTFGLEYTTSIEVDRIKLNELVLRDRESLIKLNLEINSG